MYQSKNQFSTDGAAKTVELAPVNPAYVINAEKIMQCIVGKIVKSKIYITAFIIMLVISGCAKNSTEPDADDNKPKIPTLVFKAGDDVNSILTAKDVNDTLAKYGITRRSRNNIYNAIIDAKTLSFDAFMQCYGLVSVSSENLLEINSGNYGGTISTEGAFVDCSSLENVSFPNLLTIGDCAFQNCDALQNVNIPLATSIGEYAFYSCEALKTIDVPNVPAIKNYVFKNCYALESVSFPSAVSIGQYAFDYCYYLKNTTFNDNLTIIEYQAFGACSTLVNASFPNVTQLGQFAFDNCVSLTSASFPKLKTIESYTFQRCRALKNIAFDNVTNIGGQSFEDCFSLVNIVFQNVDSIQGSAFSDCGALVSATFPKWKTISSSGVFSGCNSLSLITIGTNFTGPTTFKCVGGYGNSSAFGVKTNNVNLILGKNVLPESSGNNWLDNAWKSIKIE